MIRSNSFLRTSLAIFTVSTAPGSSCGDYNFPSECCIKPTHLSGEFILKVQDTKINYEKIKKWFSMNYYYRSREANYKFLKPKVIVETLVFNDSNIRDYRIFCYKGKAKLILVDCMPKHSSQTHRRSF